jgi:hypothetical protein
MDREGQGRFSCAQAGGVEQACPRAAGSRRSANLAWKGPRK